MSFDFPSPPETVLLPMNPTPFERELRAYPTPGSFVRHLVSGYSQSREGMMADLKAISFIALPPAGMHEPTERELFMQYFSIGSILGTRVMELERGDEFADRMFEAGAYLPVPELAAITDTARKIEVINHVFIDACEYGFAMAEPYQEVMGEIGDKISTEYDQQPYVRRGFGLAMFMARQCIARESEEMARADFEQMEQMLSAEEGIDWDAWAMSLQPGEETA